MATSRRVASPCLLASALAAKLDRPNEILQDVRVVKLKDQRLEELDKYLAVEIDWHSSVEVEVLAAAVSALQGNVRCRAVVLLKPRDELASPLALGVGAFVMKLLVDRADEGGDVRADALKGHELGERLLELGLQVSGACGGHSG
eukprot:6212642-Pleurochrysis_carterae.AAC.1